MDKSAPILRTEGLTRDFGALRAVNQVALNISKGELRSIIGPNGAGKTTLFNLIAGHLRPTAGRIFYREKDITDLPLHERSRRGMGRSFQVTNIFPRLTTFENVRIACQSRKVAYDVWRKADAYEALNERTREILGLINLYDKRDQLAGTLSYGEQRYLEIGISLATNPEVLLLDEPTAGMSPEESMKTSAFIRGLSDITIVLVEHDMQVVMGISDRVTVMHEGSILAEGSPAEIRCNADVQKVYLREELCLS